MVPFVWLTGVNIEARESATAGVARTVLQSAVLISRNHIPQITRERLGGRPFVLLKRLRRTVRMPFQSVDSCQPRR